MTEKIISLYNAYLMIGTVATLLHILSMLTRKQNPASILKVSVITFIAWPALPYLYLKYRKYRKDHEKPLGQRDSVDVMLKATRNHFDQRPFIVVAYDLDKESLHVYSSTGQLGRAELLRHAAAANDSGEMDNPG